MKFHYNVNHVPGKLLYIADALSRAPINRRQDCHSEEVEVFMDPVTQQLPAMTTGISEWSTG